MRGSVKWKQRLQQWAGGTRSQVESLAIRIIRLIETVEGGASELDFEVPLLDAHGRGPRRANQ